MKTVTQIGEEVLGAKQRLMKEDEAMLLAGLVCSPKLDAVELPKDKLPRLYLIAEARCEWASIDVEKRVLVLIAGISDRPGVVVLYCAALKTFSKKIRRKITLEDFGSEIFPNGFPTHDELHRIWDNQKVHDGKLPDNIVDRQEAWAA